MLRQIAAENHARIEREGRPEKFMHSHARRRLAEQRVQAALAAAPMEAPKKKRPSRAKVKTAVEA